MTPMVDDADVETGAGGLVPLVARGAVLLLILMNGTRLGAQSLFQASIPEPISSMDMSSRQAAEADHSDGIRKQLQQTLRRYASLSFLSWLVFRTTLLPAVRQVMSDMCRTRFYEQSACVPLRTHIALSCLAPGILLQRFDPDIGRGTVETSPGPPGSNRALPCRLFVA